MANYQQHQQPNSFGQYFGYGTGVQYDNSNSQNKWGTTSNTGNQTQISQGQNQQVYQGAAQNYTSSGFYGSQAYGQQQSYAGSVDNSMSVGGARNTNSGTGNNPSIANKPMNSYNSASTTSTTGSTNMSMGSNSYQTGFGSGASFSSNTTEHKSGMNAPNQMLGVAYGNTNQNSGMNSSMSNSIGSSMTGNMTGNMTSNMSMAVPSSTSQTQSYGTTVTADTLSQFNQMSQLFGNGTNYGAYTSGDSTGGNFSAGYNQAFNSGMMTLLQQSLLQQANGGTAYGIATGNTWGMSDGDGGFYAPPADSNYQAGSEMGTKHMKKGKKWSGKEKQDFYGSRFAQMFTGMPGILGQSQSGAGKGKRLMDGVRFNIKGEKVMDVEIPLSLYSRWGQLRKFFSKQDTEVAKHLIEFHDQMCEECLEREQRKKKKQDVDTEPVDTGAEEAEEAEEPEMSEEDLMIKEVMGFGNFNTPRETMSKGNQVDATHSSTVSESSAKSKTSTSWEAAAGFIGPQKPTDKPSDSQSGPILTEQEKEMMAKLGWSVFNKKNKNGDQNDDDDDNDNDDDEGKMDIGGKDGTAAKDQ